MNLKLGAFIILFFPMVTQALGVSHPRSTKQILHSIANKKSTDFYGRIINIPPFDSQRHSDGCSGGMSATYAQLKFFHAKYGQTLPWRQCCVVHDRAYYNGGHKKEKVIADKALKKCVSEVVGRKYLGFILGSLMEQAVWVGGRPYFPTTYRWGYGEDFRDTEELPINDTSSSVLTHHDSNEVSL